MESIDLFEEKYVRFMPDDELLGKKCYVSNSIKDLKEKVESHEPDSMIMGINWNSGFPFIDKIQAWRFAYYDPTRIRLKKYRPFENAKELVSLWESRYNPSSKQRCSNSMPLIWIKNKTSGRVSLIIDYCSRGIHTSLSSESWKDLSENWTFLDGKPCGKEIKE